MRWLQVQPGDLIKFPNPPPPEKIAKIDRGKFTIAKMDRLVYFGTGLYDGPFWTLSNSFRSILAHMFHRGPVTSTRLRGQPQRSGMQLGEKPRWDRLSAASSAWGALLMQPLASPPMHAAPPETKALCKW